MKMYPHKIIHKVFLVLFVVFALFSNKVISTSGENHELIKIIWFNSIEIKFFNEKIWHQFLKLALKKTYENIGENILDFELLTVKNPPEREQKVIKRGNKRLGNKFSKFKKRGN